MDNRPVTNPPAAGVRIGWNDVPVAVQQAIESRLGSAVVRADSKRGGFSPGLAAELFAADGRSVFVKAVGPEINPDAPTFNRREALVSAELPATAPTSRLLWQIDQGPDGWVILGFEPIIGTTPAMPWQADELALVVQAIIDLSDTLTPSPLSSNLVGTLADWGLMTTRWWEMIAANHLKELDRWYTRHAAELIGMEDGVIGAVAGNTLCHCDLRADNLLLTDQGVIVVDWPHARIGPAWVDIVAMAPSVVMQGGPDAETFVQKHPAVRSADPVAITRFLATLAGFFLFQSLQPAPLSLPTLRAFQRAQADVARDWLAQRTGWQ